MPEEDPDYVLKLPDSPWTYANGSLNPALQPAGSSSSIAPPSVHQRKPRKVNKEGVSNVPPYHPDYGKTPPEPQSDGSWDDSEDEEEDEHDADPQGVDDGYEYSYTASGVRQRRGSEGYEVGPIDREALLRQHVFETTGEPGRYNWYVPAREGEQSSSEDEVQERDDDDVPIAGAVMKG